MASWTEIFEEMEAAGDDSVDTLADGTSGTASGSGAAVLDNARFIPDLESKKKLLETVESNSTYKAAYEWLNHAILFCEFIVPGNKFDDVKMGTITIIMRMRDPDHICGDDVKQTMSRRQRCTHALAFLGNVSGELLCTWETTNIDEDE